MEIESKKTGSALTASEFNQIPDELETLISKAGIAPSSTNLTQVAQSVCQMVGDANYFSTSGTSDAIILNAVSPRIAPSELTNGYRARFQATADNNGNVTVNLCNLGTKKLLLNGKEIGSAVIKQGNIYDITYVKSTDSFELFKSGSSDKEIGGTMPIGTIIPFLIAEGITPEGYIKPDNAEFTDEMFPDLWQYYLQPNPMLEGKTYLDVCTYEEQAQDIATNGFSTKWAVDLVSKTFKVPLLNDNYTAFARTNLATTVPVIGDGKTLGMTNGEQNAGTILRIVGSGRGLDLNPDLYGSQVGIVEPSSTFVNNTKKATGVTTDPTKSGLIADLSSVNTTGAKLKWFIYVANAQINQSAFDYNNYMQGLQGKANTDLSNLTPEALNQLSVIEESYVNGTSGYRIWRADNTGFRYCEQWGLAPATPIQTYPDKIAITYLKPFKDNDYNITLGINSTQTGGVATVYFSINSHTPEGFKRSAYKVNELLYWRACGYIANEV